jgi:hypothetical protein
VGILVTVRYDDGTLRIPDGIKDLASFRRWLSAGEIPENASFWWLKGEVWVDVTPESVVHRAVKDALDSGLDTLVRTGGWGRYFPDALFCNSTADIAGRPDGVFVQVGKKEGSKVRVSESRKSGVIVEGSPALAVEVVFDSSVVKDRSILRQAYYEAGVQEYWQAHGNFNPALDILKPSVRGYRTAPHRDGWVYSNVFLQWFRLTRHDDPDGGLRFTLETR